METVSVDVIVAGGGPAGITAAITCAKAGLKVLLIERGKFCGAKNMFGGAIYAQPMKEIFPNFEENAPLERKTSEHKYAILTENEGTVISYKNQYSENTSYSVIRSKFDRWMGDEAQKAGVIILDETVVLAPIVDNDYVVGVKTELEDIYAKVVILADGVNSLLAKQLGLRENLETKDVALSVKEVIKLDKQKINDRFNLNDREGCIWEIFGSSMLNELGIGFLYTNEDSISIGLGITLNELVEKRQKAYELLETLKKHPVISPLIKDGELIEYSAHLIPEGGFKKIPKLYANGVMVSGDAAMLVNNLHWEGTNLAMISGKFAGETAISAIKKDDVSEESLCEYQSKLENSFVMKDLKAYRNLMSAAHRRKKSFFGFYFEKINEFFEMFTSTDSIPKRTKYFKFIKNFLFERSITEIFKDAWGVMEILWGILYDRIRQ